MKREHVTLAQGAFVTLFVGAISWGAVSIARFIYENGAMVQRDAKQDKDIEELRAWRSVAEQALRDCRPERTGP